MKQRKINLQPTNTDNLNNKEGPKKDVHICFRRRKRQVFLSKLTAWESQERVEGEEEEGRGEEKMYSSYIYMNIYIIYKYILYINIYNIYKCKKIMMIILLKQMDCT